MSQLPNEGKLPICGLVFEFVVYRVHEKTKFIEDVQADEEWYVVATVSALVIMRLFPGTGIRILIVPFDSCLSVPNLKTDREGWVCPSLRRICSTHELVVPR